MTFREEVIKVWTMFQTRSGEKYRIYSTSKENVMSFVHGAVLRKGDLPGWDICRWDPDNGKCIERNEWDLIEVEKQ